MSNTWTLGNYKFSNGPDVHIGGPRCPEHHEGVREGISDHCCCCDPCRYIRPNDEGGRLISSCCRCVPRLLCITFTPDVTANACCRIASLAVPPVFSEGELSWDQRVTYSANLNGIDVVVSIAKDFDGGPCSWRVESSAGYITEQLQIDHVNVTCLGVPDIEITGAVDASGCIGTITCGTSDMVKVPFRRPLNPTPMRMIVPTWQGGPAQCNCPEVPEYLCVDGVRHRGELREQVRFIWDEGLGDRWSYLPCNGNVTTDQEHIYLRGDHYGNCYLEFDFEQSGIWTNDWAVPPNSLGADVNEIRDGMVAVESCGCDMSAFSEVNEIATIEFPTSRFVNITAGECSCWKYLCGSCRCVSRRVCVTGQIDGELVIADGIWNPDEEVWDVAADGATAAFKIRLGPDECGECALSAEGTFSTPFYQSQPVDCGEAMSGEMFSQYDSAFPNSFNWLWVTAAPCDCAVSPCFLCLEERCGGMPEILYYDITTRVLPGFPLAGYEEFCNLTVELHYFKRFFGISRQIICGYVGYQTVSCPASESRAAFTRVIRVSILSGGPGAFNYQIDYAELSAASPGPLVFAPMFGNTSRPAATIVSCDPFVADTGWFSMPVNCRWGCADIPSSEQPTDMREMFTE